MARISCLPDQKDVEAAPTETILHALVGAGIPHVHVCGGRARCSTCRVLVLEGLESCATRNTAEQTMADKLHFCPTIRLACQTTVTGNIKLRRLVLDDEDIELADQAKQGPTPALVGNEQSLAILFADIRGFTPFAESLPAYDVVHVLNRYFHRMGRVIEANGGCIDNYMGDGLMALFGVENPETAARQAVQSGLGMLAAMEEFKPYLQSVYGRSFEIGIGVHYGEVVVGTIGSGSRKRVTAIGDAVNLASRIEQANKSIGTQFLISEDVRRHVEGLVCIKQSVQLALPGKSGEYALYEVNALG